jgi:lysophospholipase L1-like esterase
MRSPLRRLGLAATALLFLATACLPAAPAAGRPGPVRRVLVLGDSITFGAVGASPGVGPDLERLMGDRGLELRVIGYPASTPLAAWDGVPWSDKLAYSVAAWDPDMIVIQSILFPGGADPARHDAYRSAVARLFDIARSRDAHTYVVHHARPPREPEGSELAVAEQLQAEAALGRGIEAIPLDEWLGYCDSPYISDGWHLSASGQKCHATAIAGAVDQLVDAVG